MSQRTCSIDGCERKHLARGWCATHYSRWREHGDPLREPEPRVRRTCSVAECDDAVKARTWCSHHLERFYRYGDPTAIPPRVARAASILEAGAKECSKCGRLLPLDDFSPDAARLTGTRAACNQCTAEVHRQWIAAHPDTYQATRARYRQTLPDDVRQRAREGVSRWKKSNPDAVRAHNDRRRALKAGSEIGDVDLDAVWDKTEGRCGICGERLSKETRFPDPKFASLDHIIPLSIGGPHRTENLQYACLTCNCRKGARV